jgi:DNA-binding transcriptional LysR family regulator
MLNEIDLSRADLNLLVLFEVVLQERHVGRAADRLRLSPSAVSHGLARLRRMLNDPLFLRTPKGVIPTERAADLAGPIADILARVRGVVSSADPFDAATSTRRFTIGAPDAAAAVVLPALLKLLGETAPGVNIAVRQLLPPASARSNEQAWRPVLDALEAPGIDVALVPLREVPPRFAAQTLYEEDFVIAAQAGHPFARDPSLERFCRMQHLVVSMSGDAHGFVDDTLAEQGLARRVALTVPNFMMAMALIAETGLVGAMPRHLVARHGAQFGIVASEPPFPIRRDPIRAIATKAAMMDAGVAWLFETLLRAEVAPPGT